MLASRTTGPSLHPTRRSRPSWRSAPSPPTASGWDHIERIRRVRRRRSVQPHLAAAARVVGHGGPAVRRPTRTACCVGDLARHWDGQRCGGQQEDGDERRRDRRSGGRPMDRVASHHDRAYPKWRIRVRTASTASTPRWARIPTTVMIAPRSNARRGWTGSVVPGAIQLTPRESHVRVPSTIVPAAKDAPFVAGSSWNLMPTPVRDATPVVNPCPCCSCDRAVPGGTEASDPLSQEPRAARGQ